MRFSLTILVCAAVLAGCSDDKPTAPAVSGNVVLITDATQYQVGDTAYITVRNNSPDSVAVWNCSGIPWVYGQRFDSTSWQRDNNLVHGCGGPDASPVWLKPAQSMDCYQPTVLTEPGRFRFVLRLGQFDLWHPTLEGTVVSREIVVR